jgi:hypothetical protein
MPFTTIVEETVRGQAKTLLRKDLTNYHLPLYRASGASKAANARGSGQP